MVPGRGEVVPELDVAEGEAEEEEAGLVLDETVDEREGEADMSVTEVVESSEALALALASAEAEADADADAERSVTLAVADIVALPEAPSEGLADADCATTEEEAEAPLTDDAVGVEEALGQLERHVERGGPVEDPVPEVDDDAPAVSAETELLAEPDADKDPVAEEGEAGETASADTEPVALGRTPDLQIEVGAALASVTLLMPALAEAERHVEREGAAEEPESEVDDDGPASSADTELLAELDAEKDPVAEDEGAEVTASVESGPVALERLSEAELLDADSDSTVALALTLEPGAEEELDAELEPESGLGNTTWPVSCTQTVCVVVISTSTVVVAVMGSPRSSSSQVWPAGSRLAMWCMSAWRTA